jgi:hypothetical protein
MVLPPHPGSNIALIAFSAVAPDIFHSNAKRIEPQLANPQHLLPPMDRVNMPCLHPGANNSALTGLGSHHVPSEAPVQTFMAAASVEGPAMALVAANPNPDPRKVVTPLNPIQVEELLCKYGLISTWNHIIVGLREGFDVGIREQLSCSYIFPQSQFFLSRLEIYFILYCWRASSWVVLRRFSTRGPRSTNWTFLNVSTRLGTKTAFREFPHDPRHVLPAYTF